MSYEVKLSHIAHSMGPYLKTRKKRMVGATKAKPHSCVRWR
jgi:hypothetical protein